MGSLDWERIEPILARLLDLDPAQRTAELGRIHADDPELARELERILELELGSDDFLSSPRSALPGSAADEAVGRYRLQRRVGRGGMGEVWLASRVEGGFEQRVALKLLHAGLATRELQRRFETERQILAWLEHPSIARLVDGGVHSDGRPYIAMEFVDGQPIDRYCERRGLSVEERLALFLEVCDAVEAAHERGVVHRDIKPSNVLVTPEGRAKLLDFGIAKVLSEEDPLLGASATRTGHLLYSPGYASPEQVCGEPVTMSSDVYGLGVLLCELLTGERPYDTGAPSQRELERIVCEDEPSRPSELVSEERRARLAGDLDCIVGMALRKEPERRYSSVKELALDVRRHLRGERVLARPDTWRYRARRFTGRHRALVAGTAGVVLALLVGVAIAANGWRAAHSSERAARRSAYSLALQSAELSLREGNVAAAEAQLEAAPPELRGWEHRLLVGRLDGSELASREPAVSNGRLALSPDGAWVVFRSSNGVEVLDARSLGLRASVDLPVLPRDDERGFVRWQTPAIHPGGALIATGCRDGVVRILDSTSLAVLHEVDLGRTHVYSVAYDPSGRHLACGLRSGEVVLLEHPGYGSVARVSAHGSGSLVLAFSPDGTFLATGSWDESVGIWSVPSMEERTRLEGHDREVTDLAFADGGARLVTTSIDGTARVWDVERPDRPLIVRPHRGSPIEAVALATDGETVFTGAADGTIVRWGLATGRRRALLLGHRNGVDSLVADARGALLSAGAEGGVRRWRADADDVRSVDGCEFQRAMSMHPAGEEFAVGGADGIVRRWRLPGLEPLAPFDTGAHGALGVRYVEGGEELWIAGSLGAFAVDRQGRRIASARTAAVDRPRTVWIDGARGVVAMLLGTGQLEIQRPGRGDTECFALGGPDVGLSYGIARGHIGPGGEYLYAASDGRILSIDPDARESRLLFETGPYPLVLVACAEGFVVGWNGGLGQWDRSGAPVWEQPLGLHPIAAAPHPSEPRLAIGTQSGEVGLVDAVSGDVLVYLHGHDDSVDAVGFTPDGRTLVSASADGTARIWTVHDE